MSSPTIAVDADRGAAKLATNARELVTYFRAKLCKPSIMSHLAVRYTDEQQL